MVPIFKEMRVFPTILFTKFDHLVNDIKARIKAEEEEEDDDEKKLKPAEKEAKIVNRATEVISDYMNRVLDELPRSKFFIFNPNSKKYGYKFEYGPQNQPGSNKVIIKKFVQNEGLTKMLDIVPIQNHLESMCTSTVPTVYQNETCLFLYQFTKTFFENLVLNAQDTPAAKKH